MISSIQIPTEELRIFCTTEQLALVAAMAARAGMSLEEFVTKQLSDKLDEMDRQKTCGSPAEQRREQ